VWANKRDLGMWLGLRGGVSGGFEFPEIGKKRAGDTQTEKGNEGYRLMAGEEQGGKGR
jgi:signal peptidase complex subunit 3